MDFSLPTIGAVAFGLLMGYVFAWTSKTQTPNGGEVASLIGTVFGGAAISTIQQFQSANALPAYCIGAAAGFALYIVLVQFNLTKINESMSRGVITRNPLFPWRLERPCSVAQCPHFNMQPPGASTRACGGCKG